MNPLFALPKRTAKGVIIVLEAPIFSAPNRESKLLDLARKGQSIYIHPRHLLGSSYDRNYLDYNQLAIDNPEVGLEGEEFYETMDKNGNSGYVPKKFVKVVFQDDREFTQNISPFENDPTDYRLEEPLPDTYPLTKKERRRAYFTFGSGPDLKANYPYSSALVKESFSNRYALNLAYLFKADWDKNDRFYFGINIHAWSSQAKFTLIDSISATETKGQLAIGPMISYDFWRNMDWRFSASGALSLNYNRVLIALKDPVDENFEERAFRGLSISPKISTFIQKRNFIKDVDFIFGMDYQAYLPHKLQSNTPRTIPEIWSSTSDSWDVPFSGHWTFNVGFQSNY
tara:strand:+ start:66117 stop:67142 length:1026 start_codon:yes stop_codon:yes gene_type:complete